MILRLALAALVVASCIAAPPVVEAPPESPLAVATPTATPSPSPSPPPDPMAVSLLDFLAIRDAAQRSGDPARVLDLLDPRAPVEFRERELALARIAAQRNVPAPRRTLVRYSGGLGAADGPLQRVEVLETDEQGRTRQIRYFFSHAGRTVLTEPVLDSLGPAETRSTEQVEIRFRQIDRLQARVAEPFVIEAIASLVARLGDDYRLRRPLSITLAPTTVAGLPPVASGFVNDGQITLLSSHSMVVDEGPGAEWARMVVTHEVAHILLFQRGTGPFVLLEGIPLWLTDDRRQRELDRLVAEDALWDLAHLVEGPRDTSEFFAGYAQASSFVRYLAATHGDRPVIAAWEAGRRARFDEAFRSAFGVDPTDAHAAWLRSLTPRGWKNRAAASRSASCLG